MDAQVVAALIGMGALTLTAVIAGTFGLVQSRSTASHVKDIKTDTQQLRPNGGSSVYDLVNRLAATALNLQDTVRHIADEQAHVRNDLAVQQAAVKEELERFRSLSDEDKAQAREEATRMWAAIEAVANATPPEGDQS